MGSGGRSLAGWRSAIGLPRPWRRWGATSGLRCGQRTQASAVDADQDLAPQTPSC
jgi:hypothetical protein